MSSINRNACIVTGVLEQKWVVFHAVLKIYGSQVTYGEQKLGWAS